MKTKKKSGIRKMCMLYLTKNEFGIQTLGYQWVNGLDQIREVCCTIVTSQPYAICKHLRELAEIIEQEDRKPRHPKAPIPTLGVPLTQHSER